MINNKHINLRREQQKNIEIICNSYEFPSEEHRRQYIEFHKALNRFEQISESQNLFKNCIG